MKTDFCADSVKSSTPAIQAGSDGSNPISALHFSVCEKPIAVDFVRKFHSRLPKCQDGPWKFAFKAELNGCVVAVALWNNPSARCLPGHWLELRRLACSPQAPRNTCSCFLGWMARWIRKSVPQHEKLISYQDLDVHKGTIYKAAGWVPEYQSKRRTRDRSKPRVGTTRAYRSNLNGVVIDASPKIRWAKLI